MKAKTSLITPIEEYLFHYYGFVWQCHCSTNEHKLTTLQCLSLLSFCSPVWLNFLTLLKTNITNRKKGQKEAYISVIIILHMQSFFNFTIRQLTGSCADSSFSMAKDQCNLQE